MVDPLPPGPAFIPCAFRRLVGPPYDADLRSWHNVPHGYLWHPATEGTMAGWARPSGGETG